MSHFQIIESDAEQPFHVVLVGDNGEPLSSSEQLTDLAAAKANVAAQAKALGWSEPRCTHGPADPPEWVVQDDGAYVWRSVEVVMVDQRAGSEPPC